MEAAAAAAAATTNCFSLFFSPVFFLFDSHLAREPGRRYGHGPVAQRIARYPRVAHCLLELWARNPQDGVAAAAGSGERGNEGTTVNQKEIFPLFLVVHVCHQSALVRAYRKAPSHVCHAARSSSIDYMCLALGWSSTSISFLIDASCFARCSADGLRIGPRFDCCLSENDRNALINTAWWVKTLTPLQPRPNDPAWMYLSITHFSQSLAPRKSSGVA